MRLHPQHCSEQDDAADERKQHLPRPPVVLRRLDQTVDDGNETRSAGDRAGVVGSRLLAHHPALGHEPRNDHQGERRDRQVDEEDPPPRRVVDQHARDDRAGRAAAAGDPAPDSERLHPLMRVREQQCNEAERRRRGERLAEALHEASGHQHPGVGGGAAECGRSREQGDADEEQLPTPEDVGEPAAEQQEAAGHQDVTVDDPCQAGPAEAEVRLDLRQRDVHDSHVENEHELNEREHPERLPTPRVRLDLRYHFHTSPSSREHTATDVRQLRRNKSAGFDTNDEIPGCDSSLMGPHPCGLGSLSAASLTAKVAISWPVYLAELATCERTGWWQRCCCCSRASA